MTLDYDPRLTMRGSGEPVVLVPGMDGTGQLFYRQVPLLEKSHRVVTYALRDSAASMDILVNDLAGVVDAVAPAGGRAVIIGESFGGALALSFAVAHPERVSALVVLNSFPYFAPQFRLKLAIFALRLVPWGAMPFVRRLTAFRLHSPHTHKAELRRFLELTKASTEEGYRNRLRALTRYDVRGQLGSIARPTLFLAAEFDHLVPSVEQGRLMASRVPGAALRILEGHGHICLIAPDLDLARIIDEWRNTAGGAPRGPVPHEGSG
jgi:3-oxoadipate enol-lactonase/3-oxoadipate enol-lactonase/4-carboxymuconolactone decarboxylase